MYVCIHIYIYIHTCIYIYIYIYIPPSAGILRRHEAVLKDFGVALGVRVRGGGTLRAQIRKERLSIHTVRTYVPVRVHVRTHPCIRQSIHASINTSMHLYLNVPVCLYLRVYPSV